MVGNEHAIGQNKSNNPAHLKTQNKVATESQSGTTLKI